MFSRRPVLQGGIVPRRPVLQGGYFRVDVSATPGVTGSDGSSTPGVTGWVVPRRPVLQGVVGSQKDSDNLQGAWYYNGMYQNVPHTGYITHIPSTETLGVHQRL